MSLQMIHVRRMHGLPYNPYKCEVELELHYQDLSWAFQGYFWDGSDPFYENTMSDRVFLISFWLCPIH